MPTRTELIPCVACGQPRPIQVKGPADAARAATRKCRACVGLQQRTGFRPYAANIPCPQCDNPRPVWIFRAKELRIAQTRKCQACALTNITHDFPEPDEMAVARLLAGQPVKATPTERNQAVATLTRRRLSAAEIARRIGCTKRTVERHRAKLAS